MEVFLVCSDGLVRRLVSTRSPAIEIGVRPFEVDVLGDPDFHNRTGPVLLSPDMILEQPDVVFADRCREQLAKIAERVHAGSRSRTPICSPAAGPPPASVIARFMGKLLFPTGFVARS